MQAVWMRNAIALCLIVESCNGNHFEGPNNATVPEGTRATLHCQTSPSKTVWWKYFEKDVFYANTISHDFKSSHEAEVDASQGIYNLIILNASSHPGLYTCVDDDGEGERKSAWLTVTAIETTSTPSAENNSLNTVAIVIGIVACLVFIIIVIVLVFFRKRLFECCQPRASEDIPKSTVAKNVEKEALIKNTETSERPSEEQENSDNVYLEKNHQKESPACPTSIEIEETKSPTAVGYAESNLQTALSVPSPQKGPVAKPRMRNELEKPLASPTPVEKAESGNDNVNTTERESTIIDSTNTTDNTQTGPLQPETPKDEKLKVPPTVPPKPTKANESIDVPEENSQKNEAIASPGKQDSGAKEKPPLKPKPSMTSADTANVRTKSTTNSGGINRASDAEQGEDDSSSNQKEEGIPQQQDIVDTEEQDLPKPLLTEGDDKKDISFKNEQHIR